MANKIFVAYGKGSLTTEWPSIFSSKEMSVIERFLEDVRDNAEGIGVIYDIKIEEKEEE